LPHYCADIGAVAELMDNLLSKDPHYIRCIKPNDSKRKRSVDEVRLRHQVRYLGLLENVRVKRAGYVFASGAHRVYLASSSAFPAA